jgi:thiol-disulfide isomerase/thioredoxin
MPSRHHRLIEYLTSVLLATLVAGCSGASSEATSPIGSPGADPSTGSAAQGSTAGNANPINVRGVDGEGLLEFLASHKGRAIVLDIWSTSCDPCIRELPNLATLGADYRDAGVVCVSFNIDFTGAEGTTPDGARERAQEVLQALGVDVHNLFSTVPDKDLYRTELFKQNQVYAIPAILVFDQSGKVVGKFGDSAGGASPYEQVRSAIDKLL